MAEIEEQEEAKTMSTAAPTTATMSTIDDTVIVSEVIPEVSTQISSSKGSSGNNTTAISNQITKLKEANAKYKSLLKLAKGRIQTQEEEVEKIKQEKKMLEQKYEELFSREPKFNEASENAEQQQEASSENILIRVWQRVKLESKGNFGMEMSNVESSSSDTNNDDPSEIWALMEFESDPDTVLTPTRRKEWKRFGTEQSLSDFIRKDNVMGEPIQLPPYSLTPDQSKTLEEEAKKKVATVTEEFRRYRVKAEVARKQADAQLRAIQSGNVQNTQRRIEGQDLE